MTDEQQSPAPEPTSDAQPNSWKPYPVTPKAEDDVRNRFTHHPPFGTQLERYQALRVLAKNLALMMIRCAPPSRELSLALTHLQESTMWCNAAIACGEKAPALTPEEEASALYSKAKDAAVAPDLSLYRHLIGTTTLLGEICGDPKCLCEHERDKKSEYDRGYAAGRAAGLLASAEILTADAKDPAVPGEPAYRHKSGTITALGATCYDPTCACREITNQQLDAAALAINPPILPR